MDIYQEYKSQYDTIKKSQIYKHNKEKKCRQQSHISYKLQMRRLLWEIFSHLQVSGYVTLLNVDINIL